MKIRERLPLIKSEHRDVRIIGYVFYTLMIIALMTLLPIWPVPGYTAGELNDQGVDLAAEGRYEEAISTFEKAAVKDPTLPAVWYNHALTLERMDRNEEAKLSLEKTLELDPEHKEALVLQRSFLNFEKAEEILKVDMANESALLDKGVSLVYFGDFEESLEVFERLLKLDPSSPEGWMGKGQSLVGLERYQEGIEAYAVGLELDPENVEGWYYIGIALEAAGNSIEALSAQRMALNKDPEYEPAIKAEERLVIYFEKSKPVPGFEAIFAILAVLTAVYLIRRFRNK